MKPEKSAQTLSFLRRGQPVVLRNIAPDRTLLEVLREDLHLTATKEGCGEGDCGACTVVLGEAAKGKLHYKAINSCIRLAQSVNGMAVWTAEDIGEGAPPAAGGSGGASGAIDEQPTVSAAVQGGPRLHPAQQAMVNCHASQCGFCTPGFVMSLYAMYQTHLVPAFPKGNGVEVRGGPPTVGERRTISREQAQADLSGNLCRCTGYRPILDAAAAMGSLPLPPGCAVDEATTLQALKTLRSEPPSSYLRPTTLSVLLQARAKYPKAQVVAGCTDVGLWVTKQHKRFEQVLDVTAARELLRVETYPHHIAIGAAVSLNDAFTELVKERPQLLAFSRRFAGLPVRNSGTLGGNVANGSPIGDSMPLLIALGASVVLMRWKKKKTGGEIAHRELPLEDLYTGYRTNVMRADELLAWIKVPRPTGPASGSGQGITNPARHTPGGSAPNAMGSEGAQQLMKVYKISKRFDDDISAVCLAIQMTLEDGVVQAVSIGAGGVAATPVRARKTEVALQGQSWNSDTVMAAQAALRAEFQPISDMRASAHYRHTVLGNLLQRFWLESQGLTGLNLESLHEVTA